ncbi:hypothetical protein QAD02_010705 [Eretmocerus hayati]|uniref:Uncharacterized protein n=1 Tax=Eretmocerus hayati TaxID=131215 RepID=A0ACC2NUK2_9HYME|nr:hypothetical protein QAD02_010705 [Eretmocerus hayati]
MPGPNIKHWSTETTIMESPGIKRMIDASPPVEIIINLNIVVKFKKTPEDVYLLILKCLLLMAFVRLSKSLLYTLGEVLQICKDAVTNQCIERLLQENILLGTNCVYKIRKFVDS